MKQRIFANIALFLTALIWGLSFVAQRAGMEHVGPFTFNMVRSILGGISLIPVIAFVKISDKKPHTRYIQHLKHINLARAGTACGIALFIAMSIQQYCMQFVGAGKAGFITALYIIFVPIIAVLNGAKLAKNIIISICLAVVGLYLLCWKGDSGFDIYDLLILLSAFFYAIHIIVVGYYSKKADPIKISCIQFFVVGILSLPIVLMLEEPSVTSIYACRVPILYAGILTCGIAYTLQIYGQKYTLPVIASLIFCLESVFAVLGGALILGETMSVKEILGCLFMISAVVLSNLKFGVPKQGTPIN